MTSLGLCSGLSKIKVTCIVQVLDSWRTFSLDEGDGYLYWLWGRRRLRPWNKINIKYYNLAHHQISTIIIDNAVHTAEKSGIKWEKEGDKIMVKTLKQFSNGSSIKNLRASGN